MLLCTIMTAVLDKGKINRLPQSNFYIATFLPNNISKYHLSSLLSLPFILSDVNIGPLPGFVYGTYPPIGTGYFRLRPSKNYWSNQSSGRNYGSDRSSGRNYGTSSGSASSSDVSSYLKNNMFVPDNDNTRNFRNTNNWREVKKMLGARMKPSNFK